MLQGSGTSSCICNDETTGWVLSLNLVFEDAWQAPDGFKGLVALAGGMHSSLMVASEVGVEGQASKSQLGAAFSIYGSARWLAFLHHGRVSNWPAGLVPN
jgi:hypothetical protein